MSLTAGQDRLPLARRRLLAPAAAAALLLALVVRLAGLDSKPLWNDEAFGLRLAALPMPELVQAIAQDVHPPLYYLLLHLWLLVVPGDATGRGLSVLTGSAAVLAVLLLARRLLPAPQAVAAAAICAILPLYVSWAQVSRGYSVLLLASVLALLAATEVLARLGRDAPALRGIWPWGLLFVVAAAAALWTHNLAIFLLAGINAAAGWRLLTGQLAGTRPLLAWVACQLGALLLWAPWLPALLEQSSRLGWAHFAVTAVGLLDRTGILFGGFMLWTLGLPAALVGVTGALLGALRLDPRSAAAQVVVAALVVPILACLLLFALGRVAFGYAIGNLIWIPALVAMLLAANLRLPLPPRAVRPGLAVLLVLGFVALAGRGLSNWHAAPNPDWNGLVARLAAEIRPGDAVVALTDLTASAPAAARGEVPMHSFALLWDRLRAGGAPLPAPTLPPDGADDAALLRWMEGHDRIWLPRFVPMPDGTTTMRLIALAEGRPEHWRVVHEPVQRLGLTRIGRIPPE